MNIMTLTKTTKLDYRDFVRDDKGNLVHKSTIKKNNNVKHKGKKNDNS